MEMRQISIDVDVYKKIEAMRQSFSETHNQILRRHFGLSPIETGSKGGSEGLYIKGVHLKSGLKLRKRYKGRMIEAVVGDNGIFCEGNVYPSLAMAAREITQTSINAWIWWEYYDDDSGFWQRLDTLRKEQSSTHPQAR